MDHYSILVIILPFLLNVCGIMYLLGLKEITSLFFQAFLSRRQLRAVAIHRKAKERIWSFLTQILTQRFLFRRAHTSSVKAWEKVFLQVCSSSCAHILLRGELVSPLIWQSPLSLPKVVTELGFWVLRPIWDGVRWLGMKDWQPCRAWQCVLLLPESGIGMGTRDEYCHHRLDWSRLFVNSPRVLAQWQLMGGREYWEISLEC